jgi:L-threonylcarbamoyladenylate synthase
LPLILDGGATPGNIASTVVDVTTNPPTIRRVGVIGVEEIEKVIGHVQ